MPLCNDLTTGKVGSPLQRLRQGWVDFLGRWPWHWFCTFTFDPRHSNSPRGLVHPEKALKAFGLFVNNLNCELFGQNWKRRGDGVYFVIALEPHKSGILHIHALPGSSVDLNAMALRVTWKEWWFQHFGIAGIEKPKDAGDVQGYCSKYVIKGGELEISANLKSMAVQ